MQWYRIGTGEEWLESCPAEEDLEVLANMSQECVQGAKEAKSVFSSYQK